MDDLPERVPGKRVDPMWRRFEQDLALRPTSSVVERLGLTSAEVALLRSGRHRPRFEDLPTFGLALEDDPLHFARLMRMVPDAAEQFREIVELQSQIATASARLREIERAVASARGDDLAVLVAALVADDTWKVTAWAEVDGPPTCRIRDHDLIEIRPRDGRRASRRQVYQALKQHFDPLGVRAVPNPDKRLPFAGEDDVDLDRLESSTLWLLPQLARRTGPTEFSPLTTSAVTVLATGPAAQADTVGALLARAIGFGYTSSVIAARARWGSFEPNTPAVRDELHHRWAERPIPRHVWSHAGLQDRRDALRLEALTRDEDMLVVWCDEPDEVLDRHVTNPRASRLAERRRVSRDTVRDLLDGLPAERVVRLDVLPTAEPGDRGATGPTSAMTRSLDLVAELLRRLVPLRIADRARLNGRFEELRRLRLEEAALARYLGERVLPGWRADLAAEEARRAVRGRRSRSRVV